MGRLIGRSRSNRRNSKNKKNIKSTANRVVEVTTTKQNEPPRNTELQIVDINDDCLIKIFDLLDVVDLVNMSIVSERFISPAGFAFKKKLAGSYVTVTNRMPMPRPLHHQLSSNVTDAEPLNVSLLKNFGHFIEKLIVDYTDSHRFSSQIEQSIMNYCEKSLTKVVFRNADRLAFNPIEKRPFPSVTKVVFDACTLGQFIFDFNKWFPNARCIQFLNIKIITATDVQCIERHLPELQYLAIANGIHQVRDAYKLCTNVNVKKIIDCNPQLMGLKLKHDNALDPQNYFDHCGIKITPTLLAYINEKLPLLDTLELIVSQTREETDRERRQVHFRNLREIKLTVDNAQTFSHYEISTRLPAKITLAAKYNFSHCCGLFLSTNKNWKEIVLHGAWQSYQSYESVKIRLTSFWLLKRVVINAEGLNGKHSQVLALLTECKFLTNLKICFSVLTWSQRLELARHAIDKLNGVMQPLYSSMCNCLLKNWKDFRLYTNSESNAMTVTDIEAEVDGIRIWTMKLKAQLDNGREVTTILKNQLFYSLDILGELFLKIYKEAFEAERLTSVWTPSYNREGREGYLAYWAVYEKKDVEL